MLDFTPASSSGRRKPSSADANSAAITSEPASIGSPRPVPVPCASLRVRSSEGIEASPHAATSSACCACPFGAVRLALRPSCLTALPTTPISLMLAALSEIAPQPSPRAYPLARASNV
eukprot:2713678-Prymnesium_polylepis.2